MVVSRGRNSYPGAWGLMRPRPRPDTSRKKPFLDILVDVFVFMTASSFSTSSLSFASTTTRPCCRRLARVLKQSLVLGVSDGEGYWGASSGSNT
eukprot:364740-Hanusia_phi.AAC.2